MSWCQKQEWLEIDLTRSEISEVVGGGSGDIALDSSGDLGICSGGLSNGPAYMISDGLLYCDQNGTGNFLVIGDAPCGGSGDMYDDSPGWYGSGDVDFFAQPPTDEREAPLGANPRMIGD